MFRKRYQIELIVCSLLLAFAVAFQITERVHAAESYFSHSHRESCYKMVDATCNDRHVSSYNEEYQIRNCTVCGTGTSHKLSATTITCPVQFESWQPDGKCTCTVCGTTTNWASAPKKSHASKVKRVICGMEEGETTATLSVSADTSWTNKGVTISARVNVLKEDDSSSGITLSWPDGKLVAEENGTYTVTATNSLGQSISASATIACIDRVAPVIGSVTGNTDTMTKSEITVSFSASDGESGLAESPYSLDEGSTWSGNNTFTLKEGTPVTITVRDKAGNTASKTVKRGDFPYPKEPEKPAPGGSTSGGSGGGTSGGGSSSSGGTGNAGSGSSSDSGSGSSGGGSNTTATGNGSGSESGTGGAGSKTGNTSKDSEKKKEDTKKEDKNSADGKNGASGEADTEADKITDKKVIILPNFGSYPLNNRINNVPLAGEAETEEEVEESAATDIEISGAEGSKEDGIFTTLQVLLSENLTDIVVGTVLLVAAAVVGILIWSHSVEVYCYDGGDSYKKLGVAFVKKSDGNYEMSLPENMTDSKNIPRYRLILKKNFAKHCKGMSLTILAGDRKLQQSMEECMDLCL